MAEWWQASRVRVQRLAGRARPTTWSLDPIHASVKILNSLEKKKALDWPSSIKEIDLMKTIFLACETAFSRLCLPN